MEFHLNEVLDLDPHNAVAHRQLAMWLALRGQRTEAVSHWLAAIREGQFSIADLCYVAAPEIRLSADDDQISEWIASEHPAHWLAAACSLLGNSKPTRAEKLLQKNVKVVASDDSRSSSDGNAAGRTRKARRIR